MEGYSFKSNGILGDFNTNKSALEKTLKKRGLVNYTQPIPESQYWVNDGDKGDYPYWGLSGVFGKIVKVEINELE
jgi:hypothetical protein